VPKFDASSIGGDLDYDFGGKLGQDGVKGTIPEPSRFQVKKFFKETQKLFKSLKLVDEDAPEQASPDSISNVMNSVDDEEMFEKLTDGLTDLAAELCGGEKILESVVNKEDGATTEVTRWIGGSPTHAQITALSYRGFMVFFGYIMENLMNPELQRPVTRNSPGRLRSV
jgi:hypothetical protein